VLNSHLCLAMIYIFLKIRICHGKIFDMYCSLRERNKGPTARNCADGNLSGPSAQHKNKVDKQDRRRHIIAVGIGRAVPMAAVGTIYADG
jgi:hypothetical protein